MIRKISAFVLLAFFLSLTALSVAAQQFDKAKLDELLDTIAKKDYAMGSLAVAQNGQVIYTRAIGQASIENKIAATPQTRYRIGSISKTFTSVMILQLAEQKKLTLETTLDKFFPGVANAKKITIAQMLNHTSGIHSFTDDPEFINWFDKPKTQAELVKIISDFKPDFEPGAKYHYSNSGYVLLGYIVEKLTKKTYPQALDKMILKKAGLTETYYGGKIDTAKKEGNSYGPGSGWQKMPETDMSIPHGAGALVSTASDQVKFITALFNGKLISPASLAKMTALPKDGYGLGIHGDDSTGAKAFGHNGGIDGFTSTLRYFPDSKIAVCFLSNGQKNIYPNNLILQAGFNAATGKALPPIPEQKTYAIKSEELDKYTGTYSKEGFPLKITIMKDGDALFAQATGQSRFPLSATEKDKFAFPAGGVAIEFDMAKNTLTVIQNGRRTEFAKEK